MPSLHRKFVKAWERTQVELHGSYLTECVVELAKYTREKSWAHIVMVLFVTPLPCLTITVLSDVLPLDELSEGLKVFQVRQFYSYVVMSFLCAQQFRTSVRALPYPNRNVVRDTGIVAALMSAVLYGFASWIGFPTPFSIVIAMPVWVVIITVAMAIEWLRPIQQNPGTGTMVFNTIKVWLCEVLLVVTYPPYYYVFTTLPKTGQMFFASLLPVIKLIMGNIFTMVHLSDEMPEMVVFNSEVFNALFVSYCMQNSPSFGTTLMVTTALLVQLAMSVRDGNVAINRTELVGRHLLEQFNDPCEFVAKSSIGGRKPSALQRADSLLLDGVVQDGVKRMSSIHVRSASNLQLSVSKDGGIVDRDLKFESRGTLQLQPIGARIQPAPEVVKWGPPVKAKRDSRSMSAASLQYVLDVRRLMYLTEFLVLIYYVGVFIPLIFSVYMGVMYALPNRRYYAQLADLTPDELSEALKNVMFNCALKLAYLVLLCGILQHRLRFLAIRQLAFVLERQWPGVQTKICFWVFYNVQASLEHGFDYTFKFAWLHGESVAMMANNFTTS
ncbi:hypothetical protein PHYSODRAFT_528574 [Phytophthora sojae]|uniref:Uncharacterized protein n=1 Tax=Phytophthora sojae (strain P6497) TaxID=1094619 RepID=G5A9Q1_PHYSP|nr:hypothetical protein PHYSODRAFT_528574 [Phytophthora sojae]EGZ07331.1 hypothetical protein PHYSODRAFT_528574 [Phytophthora sojae]|eukprot:XP_009536897.1 hypothetical protein PHYSODRAFT_528574 [Phytophthora sojae]